MYHVFDSVIYLVEQRTNLEDLIQEGIICTNVNKWSIKTSLTQNTEFTENLPTERLQATGLSGAFSAFRCHL